MSEPQPAASPAQGPEFLAGARCCLAAAWATSLEWRLHRPAAPGRPPRLLPRGGPLPRRLDSMLFREAWLYTRVTFTKTMKPRSKSRQDLEPRISLHDREMAAAATAKRKGWAA